MSGFGGQGIMFMGKLLTYACMLEGKNVTWLPSYGPQMRGGTANCMVVISTRRIASPYFVEPSCLIVMNRPSLKKFEHSVTPGGLIILNSSMIKDEVRRKDVIVYSIQASEIAEKIGNIRVTNMIALGAFVKVKPLATIDSLTKALNNVLSSRHRDLLRLNIVALKRGFEMILENLEYRS